MFKDVRAVMTALIPMTIHDIKTFLLLNGKPCTVTASDVTTALIRAKIYIILDVAFDYEGFLSYLLSQLFVKTHLFITPLFITLMGLKFCI